MTWRVLVTARAFWVSGQTEEARLKAAGCEVVHSPEAGPLTEEALLPLLADCDAVIASNDPYHASVFSACPRLKLVARCGVGIDRIHLQDASKWGVVITNTPGAMTEAVADYTLGLILGLARHIPQGDSLMRSGGWGELPGFQLAEKTLGLIGCGQIGQEVAKRALGFRMRVLAFDPVVERSGGCPHVEFVPLERLLRESDIVSLHAPALPETEKLIDAEKLSWMKRSACLINTARGALVDEAALLHALESGQIGGAALDVYVEEPLPPDHPLRHAPRCLLSPHNAFNAVEAVQTMCRWSADSILALKRGERPGYVCNPAVWASPALRSALHERPL
jgi:phosphoglycerate dehydrogenase-like enzyme